MARELLKDDDPTEHVAKVPAQIFNQRYQFLPSTKARSSRGVSRESSTSYAAQLYCLYLALGDGLSWRMVPNRPFSLNCVLEAMTLPFFGITKAK